MDIDLSRVPGFQKCETEELSIVCRVTRRSVKMALLLLVASGSLEELQNLFSDLGRETLRNNAETYTAENQTALLIALETRNYLVIHFLVKELGISLSQYGWFSYQGVVYENTLPLYAAIISDQMFSVDLMMESDTKNAWNLEVFIGNTDIPRGTKIEELELIGAACLLKCTSNYQDKKARLRRGVFYW